MTKVLKKWIGLVVGVIFIGFAQVSEASIADYTYFDIGYQTSKSNEGDTLELMGFSGELPIFPCFSLLGGYFSGTHSNITVLSFGASLHAQLMPNMSAYLQVLSSNATFTE